jgi:hypothetical protein
MISNASQKIRAGIANGEAKAKSGKSRRNPSCKKNQFNQIALMDSVRKKIDKIRGGKPVS